MKASTLFSLAATAFVFVSATPRQAKVRAAEPEPYPRYDDDGDDDDGGDDDNDSDGSDSSPMAGVMCGLSGTQQWPRRT